MAFGNGRVDAIGGGSGGTQTVPSQEADILLGVALRPASGEDGYRARIVDTNNKLQLPWREQAKDVYESVKGALKDEESPYEPPETKGDIYEAEFTGDHLIPLGQEVGEYLSRYRIDLPAAVTEPFHGDGELVQSWNINEDEHERFMKGFEDELLSEYREQL